MVDRTKDGPFRKLTGLIALVESLGIVPVFAGILTIANSIALWPAAVALIVFGIIVTATGFIIADQFFKGWEEIVDFEPEGYRLALQLNRFGRKVIKNEH